MQNPFLSLCYFPTTVVLIDDNSSFIDSTAFNLGDRFPLKAFTNPNKALEYFNSQPVLKTFRQHLFTADDEEGDHFMMNVDLRSVDQFIYDSQRFEEIGVLIIDQAMPEIKGIDFCKKLNRHKMRIILLTGEADHKFAVDAFNEGLIHQFILKSNPDLKRTVLQGVQRQQQEYFLVQSNAILDNAEPQSDPLRMQLSDPVFSDFFNKICQEYNIVEYYIVDSEGSFMLMDDKAKITFLVLKNAEAIDGYYDFAIRAENVPASVLESLQKHTHVPLFYSGEDLQTPPEHWNSKLYPATVLKGELDTYYYAIVPDTGNFGIIQDEIQGYYHFLRQREKSFYCK